MWWVHLSFLFHACAVRYFRVSMYTTPWTPTLVLRGLGSVSGLAVDWINRQLYWSDQQKGSVSAGPLGGLEPRLIIRGLQQPTAVAVEPFLGWACCLEEDSYFWGNGAVTHKQARSIAPFVFLCSISPALATSSVTQLGGHAHLWCRKGQISKTACSG